jgi:hypothetical protein
VGTRPVTRVSDEEWQTWEHDRHERAREDRARSSNGANSTSPYAISYTEKGALKLPKPPDVSDRNGHCLWLTNVFALDTNHPVIAGAREGGKGADGHVSLKRFRAPTIRFEPASRINTPQRLAEDLSWQALPTDQAVPAFKGEHCRAIAHVIRMLCGIVASQDAAQETAGIVGSYLSVAIPVEGRTTYGNGRDRYAAAEALRRTLNEEARQPTSPPRYLIDANTGELVIPLDELQTVARGHVGSLSKGWLDARMENLGWQRVTLDGHGIPGENGRQGFHIRRDVYRGHLPAAEHDQDTSDE